MILFITGLVLGGVSGGLTYLNTADTQISLIVAIVVAVLTWVLHGSLDHHRRRRPLNLEHPP